MSSCKTEVLAIPLTSSSSEAIKILSDELFFKTNKIFLCENLSFNTM